ncbi:MAG: hypothetical protein AUK34_08335 [Ignavibacteria bacterium CG2_30_36_16]|nr:MAG: hypothetical protein AUK34_08335 [Ignavibacteria bacterium CG2_30_36_16]PJB00860.1 MAG: hypothetical protein CO127_06795 [Ignavibacteria bacterium CG_4_9_14_3_um_filter_36_18]
MLKHNTAINFIFGIHPASSGKKFPSTFYIRKKQSLPIKNSKSKTFTKIFNPLTNGSYLFK